MLRAFPAAIALAASVGAAVPTCAAGLPALAERVGRSTVLVEASSPRDSRTGSGFLLERHGLVATALHTVDGARRIRVSIPGSLPETDASIVAGSRLWDIAVVSIAVPEGSAPPGLTLDAGEPLRPGAEVAVTGYGFLHEGAPRVLLTVRGIVSGSIPRAGEPYYVLDLAAGSGFSGGAVYRTDTGAVCGVLTRVLSEGAPSGPGGAVPVSVLRELLRGVPSP